MESRKMVLMNLFVGNRDSDIEKRFADTGTESEGRIERITLKHIHYHM